MFGADIVRACGCAARGRGADCDRAYLEGLLDTYIEHMARGAVEQAARLTLLDLETQAEP
jgi:hypothetical protein